MTEIVVTSEDIDALSRLVEAEAESIATYYEGQGYSSDQAKRMAYGGIIDSIINRVASDAWYGDSIQEVINKPSQYTPVASAGGDWQNLPAADSETEEFVEDYIAARAQGAPSTVGGATHYYNPTLADPSWGPDMNNKVVSGDPDYGSYTPQNGDETETHVFGNPQGDPVPQPSDLTYGPDSAPIIPLPPVPPRKPPVPDGFTPAPLPEELLFPWYMEGVLDLFLEAENTGSPLVLDLDGDGIELAEMSETGSVYWDIDQDGFAEASGWITGGDGLLAIDLNEDGIITDHTELFGNQSGSPNGFTTLALYDSNTDGYITSADTQFGDLLVWVDANADGYSQEDELYTLTELNITSIDLGYSNESYLIAGNEIRQESTFTMNGNTRTIVDAWFAYDNVNTVYAEDYTLDIRTLFLPLLRGYGELPSLHIAMSEDETLLEMVKDLATMSVDEVFSPDSDFGIKVREIMHRWAGVDEVDPSSRGIVYDARDLGFLEKLLGQPWEWLAETGNNPGGNPDILLTEAFQIVFDEISLRLLTQAAGRELFSVAPSYNPATDEIASTSPELDLTAIGDFIAEHDSVEIDLIQSWLNIFDFIEKSAGLDNLSSGDEDDLDTLVQNSSLTHALTFDLLKEAIQGTGSTPSGTSSDDLLLGTDDVSETIYGQDGDDIIIGFTGTDTLHGEDENDFLIGGYGQDTIWAGSGADYLSGGYGNDQMDAGAGNDVLDGGWGMDLMSGGDGNDVYVFRIGDGPGGLSYDTIYEAASEGLDTIRIIGVAPEDVKAWTDASGCYYLQYGADILQVISGTDFSGGHTLVSSYVEQIEFDGSIFWDLTAGLFLNDRDEAQTIRGSAQADIIDGNGGDDAIYGYGGNDTLEGGAGNDLIDGGDGTDTITYANAAAGATINLYASTASDGDGGTDTLIAIENITGSGYNDTLIGNSGNNVLNGGNGTDTVSYAYASGAVGANLSTGTATGDGTDTLTSIENLTGSAYGDTLTGDSNANVLTGGDGNDTLYGNAGADTLYGGNGVDTIQGNAGNDTIYGDAGADSLIGYEDNDTIYGGDDGDTIYGDYNNLDETTYAYSGSDTIYGGNGNDNIRGGKGNDFLYGDADNDTLYGGSGDDVLEGDAGTDTLYGDSGLTYTGDNGNDTLNGGAGMDTLYGQNGDDILWAGDGADVLYGGTGTNTFAIYNKAGNDNDMAFVNDWNTGTNNKIDISDILEGYTGTGLSNFVQIAVGSHTTIQVDRDGTGSTYGWDNVLRLQNITSFETNVATLESNGTLVTM